MSKFNYDDEGKQKTGGRNLVLPPQPPKTPPPSQPKQNNLFDYDESKKVVTKGSFTIFGRCPNCDNRVHKDYNQKFCGNCKTPLKWSANED